jgi:hypothetical protein
MEAIAVLNPLGSAAATPFTIKAESAPNIVIARQRQSKSPFRGTYTALLAAALCINLCLLAGHISGDLFRIPDVPGFPASVNLFTAILVRNELFLNALYRVLIKCCSPVQIPVAIKHTVTSSLLHIGGIHAGCAAASLIWLSFGMLSLLSHDAAEKKQWALFLVLGGIIMLLAVMCITAAPMVRSRYHNFFEIVHRFFGWCALLLMWMMLLLATSWGPRSAASGSQLSAIECISFGLAVSIAGLILAPWLTVRKVTVHTQILSRSIIEIKFVGSSGPGMFGRISRHALGDWHAFALVPGGRGGSSHSMIISAIGDFTRELITGPPEKLYVRAIKFPGLPSCVLMYQRSIIIATGAGMAPYLSVLPVLSRERHRLIWVGRAFRECFGDDFCDMVFAWPDVVLIDTTKVGRPDLLALAAENYRSFGADAVFVGSNPEGTREIVSGCRELGIPAFGATRRTYGKASLT